MSDEAGATTDEPVARVSVAESIVVGIQAQAIALMEQGKALAVQCDGLLLMLRAGGTSIAPPAAPPVPGAVEEAGTRSTFSGRGPRPVSELESVISKT